jgi:hypothetical protein
MDNKVIHHNPTQTISDMEFLPILRGEAPYYGNLNRPAQSAYNLANTVSQIYSWGGSISILQPDNQQDSFVLYEVVSISDTETIIKANDVSVNVNTRCGIVVAEAVFDSVSGLFSNIVICTFCPNFVYPSGSAPSDSIGSSLYLDTTNSTFLSGTASGSLVRVLGKKTGPDSIFFSGTATLW